MTGLVTLTTAGLLTLVMLGCSETPRQEILSQSAHPTKISWVRIVDGGFCDANYVSFVESKMDWLRASGLLDGSFECILCLPESLDHLKRSMREPAESHAKHVELGLANPFSLPAKVLPPALISGEVRSVLISGYQTPQGFTTLVYFGIPDRRDSIKYIAFMYRSDYFHLNYRPVWFRPSTWNAVTSDRNCKPPPDVAK